MKLLSGGQDVTTFHGDERAQALYFLKLYGRHLANCVRRVDLTRKCTCGLQEAKDTVRGGRPNWSPEPML